MYCKTGKASDVTLGICFMTLCYTWLNFNISPLFFTINLYIISVTKKMYTPVLDLGKMSLYKHQEYGEQAGGACTFAC